MVINFNDTAAVLLKEAQLRSAESSLPAWKKDIYEFIIWYYSFTDDLIQKTSGSTGTPKSISLSRDVLEASAHATISFFSLPSHSTALLCIPASYIGGKMMILRAILGKWNLTCIEPSSFNEGTSIDPELNFDFTAMVPLQVINLLDNSSPLLPALNYLIIGGAPVTADLEEKIKNSSLTAYSTYGMTETASHVALRKLDGKGSFKALDGISFSIDEHSRLVITGNRIPNSPLLTNDVVSLLSSTSFTWLGRYDSIINSGGVKILTEELELKLSALLSQPYYIKKGTHELLGETPILVVQSKKWTDAEVASLLNEMSLILPKFWTPTKVEFKSSFEKTDSGKLKRT